MSQRKGRLQEDIKREISDIVAKQVKDPLLGFVSITDVDLSRDGSHAKVFFSVYGEEKQQLQTVEGLQRAKGFVRTELGKRIRVRHVPELHFIYDPSIEQGSRINQILKELNPSDSDSSSERSGSPESESEKGSDE